GAIVLTRWTEKIESVQDMSGCSIDQKVKYTAGLFVEFCPSHEIQKLKTELWNYAMVGASHAAYTDRFHELARLVPHLVTQKVGRLRGMCMALLHRYVGCWQQQSQRLYRRPEVLAGLLPNHVEGERVGRGGRVRGTRGGNDERVNELNGQGNDQGLGANRSVEGVNEGTPDFSTIIAQQLQNLLPTMLAQVGNQGNVGNQNSNVVNENVQENVRNVIVNGNRIRTLSREVAISMLWNDFKFIMIEEFCPSHEIQKLKTELWNYAMVGASHAAYTDRFHELARLVPHLVTQKVGKGK
nr:reverse transcriptase domain-containing protein [Tanacetum cinerariifolium]